MAALSCGLRLRRRLPERALSRCGVAGGRAHRVELHPAGSRGAWAGLDPRRVLEKSGGVGKTSLNPSVERRVKSSQVKSSKSKRNRCEDSQFRRVPTALTTPPSQRTAPLPSVNTSRSLLTLLAQAASSSLVSPASVALAWRSLGARSMLDARSPSASRRARATPPPLSAFASAFADIGQRRAPTGHFFRNVAGQLNGQLLRFVATRNQK